MIDLGYVADPFYPQVNDLGQVLLPSSIWTSAGAKWISVPWAVATPLLLPSTT